MRFRWSRSEGGIISSVVPQVTELCRSAAEKVIKKPVKVVGPGVKTGLNIKLDDPQRQEAILLL